jgi:hypothetical protein
MLEDAQYGASGWTAPVDHIVPEQLASSSSGSIGRIGTLLTMTRLPSSDALRSTAADQEAWPWPSHSRLCFSSMKSRWDHTSAY